MFALAAAAALLAAITPFASEIVGGVALVIAVLAILLVPRPAPKRRQAAKSPRKRKQATVGS